jgi:hypothetical protein
VPVVFVAHITAAVDKLGSLSLRCTHYYHTCQTCNKGTPTGL